MAMESSNIIAIISMVSLLSVINLLVVFAPAKIAFADYNFAAAGDWGCSSNTNAVENGIAAKRPERVLALGDYSYQSTATCWLNIIRPTDSITKIAIGNHEDDDNEDYQKYISHFGLTNPYYSFNYNNVHVLVMDTDRTSFSSGSSQFNFVQSDLKAASLNPSIDWIIVTFHKPIYTSPNSCSSCDPSSTFRNIYQVIFDQYDVDLVLQGHVHNYQRTFPLKYNPNSPSSPIKTSSSTNTYDDPEGEIYVIVGTGGVNFHSLSGKSSFVVSQQDKRFGYMDIVFSNDRTTLQAKYYLDSGTVSDQFTIKKTITNSLPVASSQSVNVTKNTPKTISLTASDANGDPLSYSVVNQPTHGSLSGTAPSLTYTPAIDYIGTDSFTFKANDGKADSNTATVSITVKAPSDLTPPTVLSTNPADGDTGVAVSSSITATFSEVIQSTTVTGSTFTLKNNAAGTTIAGSVTLTNGNLATFDPSSSLVASTSYTATITTGVKDIAGNAMNSVKSWSFTTASASDTTAPTVLSTNPADGDTGVAVSSSITATFSEAVQSTTVTSSTYTLKTIARTSIPGTVTLSTSGGSDVATFNPSSDLSYSTSYTAAATSGIKDLAGNFLTPKSWSFTTVAAPTSSCGDNLALGTATSSGSQSSYLPTNAIDNNLNTKWYSTFTTNPWIQLDLGAQKSVCSVDIAWADGASRQYSFVISVSTDGTSFSNVFTGKSSGTSTSPQKYNFAESQARFVKITITQSHAGTTSSIAQISEIDVFGKTSASGTSSSSTSVSQLTSSSSVSKSGEGKGSEDNLNEGPSISTTQNRAPVASDDRYTVVANKPLLATVLKNDKDLDGDNLIIMSALPNDNRGGTVTINANGTITYLPATNFVGVDTFTYTISDGNGKIDRAKVSVIVKGNMDIRTDRTNQQTDTTPSQQSEQDDSKLQPNNKAGSSRVDDLNAPGVQNDELINETRSNG